MFSVKKMTVEDLEFAVHLTDTRNWNLVEEDFELMMNLEPKGCFVLFDNSERVGLIASISFGEIGWFGNLIVEENHRKTGGGSLLVRHVIDYLKNKNAKTVGLYSYMDSIPFYIKLGFEYDSDFSVLEGKAFKSSVNPIIKRAEKQDIDRIVACDSSCFGWSRKKLLETILANENNLCYVAVENGAVTGYIMTKVYEGFAEIGPLVCNQEYSDVAINLLKTILNRLEGFHVSLSIPAKDSVVLDFLLKSGIKERFRVARMFFKPPKIKDCVYVAESLERG